MRCKIVPKQIVEDGSSSRKQAFQQLRNVSRDDRIRSLILEVLVPYLKEKLELIDHNNLLAMQRQSSSSSSWNHTFFWNKNCFQLFSIMEQMTVIFYQLRYLTKRSLYFSPYLHLLGLIVRRITLADLQQPKKTSKIMKKPNVDNIPLLYRAIAIFALTLLLPTWYAQLRQTIRLLRRKWISTFFHRHSDSTFASNTKDQNNSYMQVSPPPLKPPISNSSKINRVPLNNSCPLCRSAFVNPAVASTSGYVFCYRCLAMYVRQHNKCPITQLPCSENRIFRIFETYKNK